MSERGKCVEWIRDNYHISYVFYPNNSKSLLFDLIADDISEIEISSFHRYYYFLRSLQFSPVLQRLL